MESCLKKLTRLEDENGWQRLESPRWGVYSILLNEDGECEQATFSSGRGPIMVEVGRILTEGGEVTSIWFAGNDRRWWNVSDLSIKKVVRFMSV